MTTSVGRSSGCRSTLDSEPGQGAARWGLLVIALVAAGTLVRPGVAVAQGTEGHEREWRRLTLEEAERLALESNRSLTAERGRAEAEAAHAEAAGAFRWPVIAAEAGFSRSDDPVAAFGTRLRQGRFAEEDFALPTLNHPDAVEDWGGALSVRWGALDATRWAEMSAARHGARAAELVLGRATEATVFQTRILYLDAVGAQARLQASLTAEEAARSTARIVERRLAEGLGTEADVLQAEANLSGAEAVTVAAERELQDARGRLALHLGLPSGTQVVQADTSLAVVPMNPVETFRSEPGLRSDLGASLERQEEAVAGAERATAARLPTLEAFARLSSHAPEVFGTREGNVTVGVQVSVPIFSGGALGAAADEARALERVARAEHEYRLEAARTEVEESLRAVEAARRAAVASDAARAAADEAYRLMGRRFEEGMATTTELLQTEARAAELRTRAVDARVRYHQAEARLTFALGTPVDPPAEFDP